MSSNDARCTGEEYSHVLSRFLQELLDCRDHARLFFARPQQCWDLGGVTAGHRAAIDRIAATCERALVLTNVDSSTRVSDSSIDSAGSCCRRPQPRTTLSDSPG